MSRLFITSREVQFINDITKEVIKDIVGQFIVYFPITTLKTRIHPVYEEAVKKIFENPIKLNVLAAQPKTTNKYFQFGMEQTTTLEVYVQARDLIDKGFTVNEGDFFVYGTQVYEVSNVTFLNNIYGQVEYEVGYKILGNPARIGEFDPEIFINPTKDSIEDYIQRNVQKEFIQQRGISENKEGATGDHREVRERLKEDMPDIALGEGPREVTVDESGKASTFYSDD
jgi:hypothetical protein